MPSPDSSSLPRLTLRKVLVNLIGFAVGLALFGWIVARAVGEGDWHRFAEVPPPLVLTLLACTAVSIVVNGATFWVTILPVKRLRMADLQLLNLVANMLNYAPLRLGAVARILYNLRVDRLSLLQITAWFALITYVLLLGIGACLVATLLRHELDLLWMGLVLAQMVLGGAMLQVVARNRLLARHTRGLERLATDARSLWGAMALRVVDLAAYGGRMAMAALILDMHLPATSVVVLAMVALAASLVPFGRLGFREACVALTAERLHMLGADVEAAWAQLALIESMGEAVLYVPLGAVAMVWYRKKWRERGEGEESDQ